MEPVVDVPLSFLKNLEKSRAIMELAESKKKTTPMSASAGLMSESFEPEQYLTEIPEQHMSSPTERRPYNADMVHNSNLPESVKKIMTEFPTNSPDMFVSGYMPDTSKVRMDLMEDIQPAPKMPKNVNELMQGKQPTQPVRSQQPITSNDEHIRNVVREEMLRVFGESYIEQIKKDTIKQTLTSLKKKGLLK